MRIRTMQTEAIKLRQQYNSQTFIELILTERLTKKIAFIFFLFKL